MECKTCAKAMTGRKRKYCAAECRPGYTPPKGDKVYECLLCAKPINQKHRAGNPQKYCSKRCSNKARANRLRDERPIFEKACTICQQPYQTKRAKQVTCSKTCSKQRSLNAAMSAWEKKKHERPLVKIITCKWCEEPLEIPGNFRGVIKYHAECKTPARQSQYRIKSIRRQGVKNGNAISHDRIAERDNFTCYLCGEFVDMALIRTSRYGATLDHVVPLAKGGQDIEANVRLAHWICNIRKSDMTLEEYRAKSR